MRDVSRFRVRRNNEKRDSWSQAVSVERGRRDVIVEAPEIVPGDENCRRGPVRPLHDGIELRDRPIFTYTRTGIRMLAPSSCYHPAHGGQISVQGIGYELRIRYNVLGP